VNYIATNPIIAMIFGLALIFVVTYLVGFIIVKAKKAKKSSLDIIIGFICIFFGLIGILFFNDKQDLIFCFLGVYAIIGGIFRMKGYRNKTFYLSSLVLLTLYAITLIYVAIFLPDVYDESKYFFYLLIGSIVLSMLLLIRSYLRRGKNPEKPWKNEW
jgi:uncharacterized membrane protein HdeD (DUF308 family)